MSAVLAPRDASRLRKIVGMFDSPNVPEATAAFTAARTLLAERGLKMTDALEAVLARPVPSSVPGRPHSAPAMPWERQILACRDAPHLFTSWEREFLSGISARQRITPAQESVLDRLYAKAHAYWATGGAS